MHPPHMSQRNRLANVPFIQSLLFVVVDLFVFVCQMWTQFHNRENMVFFYTWPLSLLLPMLFPLVWVHKANQEPSAPTPAYIKKNWEKSIEHKAINSIHHLRYFNWMFRHWYWFLVHSKTLNDDIFFSCSSQRCDAVLYFPFFSVSELVTKDVDIYFDGGEVIETETDLDTSCIFGIKICWNVPNKRKNSNRDKQWASLFHSSSTWVRLLFDSLFFPVN